MFEMPLVKCFMNEKVPNNDRIWVLESDNITCYSAVVISTEKCIKSC